MKNQNRLLLLAAIAAGMTACSDENPWEGDPGQGGLKLNVRTDASVQVTASTRAAGTDANAPAAADFSVKLEKGDGSYSKTWNLLEDFNNETSFSTGAYTLTAFYGNPEEEGPERPYYEGKSEVQVLEARETPVELTATLANCMVSVDYTDSFKKYFSTWKAQVHSEGHTYVDIPQGETRPMYINPGNVDLAISVTRMNGQEVRLQPANFKAEKQHHYRLTFDVKGGTGDAQLTISFDDALVQEEVNIDLTDELFTSKAPEVKASGFTDGQTIELLSKSTPENQLKYTVVAHGGMKEVMLTVAGADYTPSFGKELNLIGAPQTVQEQLANEGVKVIGLFKNPDKMASIDITDFVGNLPGGDYTISVIAKDMFTRVSEPITLNVTSVPMTLEAEPQLGLFGTTSANVKVSYNGSNPKEDITFKAMNRNGVYVDAPTVSVTETTRTRSIPVRDWLFNISLPDTDREQIPVKIYLKGSEVKQVNVQLTQPEYTVESDGYATKAALKINSDESLKASIVNALHVWASPEASNLRFVRDPENGFVWLHGLAPNTKYTVEIALSANASSENKKSVAFTTEAATAIPNGDFSQTHETINTGTINSGGEYTGTRFSSPTYFHKSSIVRSEPTGWASINGKTCWTGSDPKNTWFMVPSTYAENGEVVIRSVAYSNNGTLPGLDKTTARHYNPTAPTFKDSEYVAGELFLGSYSFNGTESRNEGINFGSRPSTVSFQYRYSPLNSETAHVIIEVLDAAGNVISSSSSNLGAAASNTNKTLVLPAYAFGSKASKLKIKFLSSSAAKPSVNIPSGSALNDGTGAMGAGTKGANDYAAYAAGSVLTIDNVSVGYTDSSASAARKRGAKAVKRVVKVRKARK